jgi:hypothetical protein
VAFVICGSQGQANLENRPTAIAIQGDQFATMSLHDPLRDGKSEPKAGILRAEKRFKDAIAIVRGKAAPVVAHSQGNARPAPLIGSLTYPSLVIAPGVDQDLAPIVNCVQGVEQQIQQYLSELSFIRLNDQRPFGQLALDRYIASFGPW